MKNAICIIPSRGGSKRIPRKNIREFRGRPMLAWSIAAAKASGAFNTIMVSTDDIEIANIAQNEGAEVPFLRSTTTSGDHATTCSVLSEVLARYTEQGISFSTACCLYPTAPFVTGTDLSAGQLALETSDFDVVMSITQFSYTIWRSLERHQNGSINLNFPENLNVRSQDLPAAYHDAGQWYWFRTAPFLRNGVLMGSNTGSIIVPSDRVQDIDTAEDWNIAELKHQRLFP